MNKRVLDESFKQMAVELSYARVSVKEVAESRGIDSSRLSKWRNGMDLPAQPARG
ncbi:transposase [Rufibacter sp. XAAS-G3-1]|uniref:transposase n=1 Tax=Rufibacter sp. XAAS-G3-1 TaxID=2729134 RepID=UPI0015E6799E|nr:transposase [Rufibacter sp. XAAS-G3-1]